jgi:hypothetical protein
MASGTHRLVVAARAVVHSRAITKFANAASFAGDPYAVKFVD